MPLTDPRRAYAQTATATASPGRLLVMLYDRLARDLLEARTAIEQRDLATANRTLLHAQDIVAALHNALDPSVWDGAAGMAALYEYLSRQLLTANVRKSVAAVQECLAIVEPLREAWHQALGAQASGALG